MLDEEFIKKNNLIIFSHKTEILACLDNEDYCNIKKVKSNQDNKLYVVKKNLDDIRLKREIEIYLKIPNTKHTVKFIGISPDKQGIVIEYYQGLNLEGYIQSNTDLTRDIDKIFLGLVEILKFLKNNDILHRDLKPKNILINENLDLKICDFDGARDDNYNKTTISGTYKYTAPECFSNSPVQISHSADIFSMGKILYYILTKQESIDINNYEWYFDNIISFPYNIIIDKMIKHNPYERYLNSEEIEKEYLEIRAYLSRKKFNPLEIIEKFSNGDNNYFSYNNDVKNNLFYYAILATKFNYKFLSGIFFNGTLLKFNYNKLKELYIIEKKIFKKLLLLIINNLKEYFKRTSFYDFELTDTLFDNFIEITNYVSEINLKKEIIDFLCFISLYSHRFPNMNKINNLLIKNGNPEIKFLIMSSLLNYSENFDNIGFIKDIEEFTFESFTFKEFIEKNFPAGLNYPQYYSPRRK